MFYVVVFVSATRYLQFEYEYFNDALALALCVGGRVRIEREDGEVLLAA